MIYLRKFNESKNYDYEITDYFVDLEDDGIITIQEIKDEIGDLNDEKTRKHVEKFILTIKNKNKVISIDQESMPVIDRIMVPIYRLERFFTKYLDHLSIQTPEDFFTLYDSGQYTPLMRMSIFIPKGDDIFDAIKSLRKCEEMSSVTNVFGMSRRPRRKWPETESDILDIFFMQNPM